MKKNGFTFIEVLVVATIIAVLSAVGVVNFRSGNQKARDGRRQGDLEQIRAALELYRTDEGEYPAALSTLTAEYMSEIPDDPSDDYDYYYSSDGSSYSLCSYLELGTGTDCSAVACGSKQCNYQVTNPD